MPYLAYAGLLGMGPTDVSQITVTGNAYSPVPFAPATTPPTVWHPNVYPNPVAQGKSARIAYKMPQACYAQLAIIQDLDATPGVVPVKTLATWTQLPAGLQTLYWDGTDDNGDVVAPGVYLAQVQTQYTMSGPINYASRIISVTA